MNRTKLLLFVACVLPLLSAGCSTHRITRRESDPPQRRDMREHRIQFTVRYSDGRPVPKFHIRMQNDQLGLDYDGRNGTKTVSIYDVDGSLQIFVTDAGNANGGAFYSAVLEKDGIHGDKNYLLVLHPVKAGPSKLGIASAKRGSSR